MTATRCTLSVNVNKVALLRNQRDLEIPSVVELARVALDAGAHGITVHPRPDGRHIRVRDVDALAELLASPEYADREFNVEGNPLDAGGGHLMPILRRVRPDQATLVPDDPAQNTSDHGFTLTDPSVVDTLKPYVSELVDLGCRVSLFVDPDVDVVRAAPATGAQRLELYTESYASAWGTGAGQETLARFVAAGQAAHEVGLELNAGHDLNLLNLAALVRAVPDLLEVSIGHALVADALTFGMTETVQRYLACLE